VVKYLCERGGEELLMLNGKVSVYVCVYVCLCEFMCVCGDVKKNTYIYIYIYMHAYKDGQISVCAWWRGASYVE
jgi:hypothetical protein